MKKTLLVTGGLGYIGSHTLLALINAGYRPIVIDNFSNSVPAVLQRVEQISGTSVEFVEGDIRDAALLDGLFAKMAASGDAVQCVVHFAALKAVGESVANPLAYYDNNVGGTTTLLEAMDRAQVRQFVFSSSATVYGEPVELPYTEHHRVSPTNPYGWTKAMVEQVLKDWSATGDGRKAVALRYFNPIGAHVSGLLGEAPQGMPNNLFPFITQVAVGKREQLMVFGDDYDTVDGTGVRDYLHVEDLADGHVRAVAYAKGDVPAFSAFNLGTGTGTSVRQLVKAFELASGVTIACSVQPRRPGDIAAAWADPTLAYSQLGWKAERTIEQMCADGWRWQSTNPDGYKN